MLSRIRVLALTASLTALSSGCALLRAPLTPPSQGGAPWSEIVSPHFTLQTDLEPDEGRALLGQFEGIYAVFKDVAFPSDVDPHDHLQVVVFAREKDYAELGPALSSGYFQAHPQNDGEGLPTLVMPGGLTPRARLTMQHELTHHFVSQALGALPPWLSEGLAQFYSTLRVEHGRLILGEPLPNVGFTLDGRWLATQRPDWQTILIPTDAVPSVAALLSADREPFYPSRDDTSGELARLQTAYYGSSWLLVHMLNNGPAEYRRRYAAFLERAARHTPVEEAWKQAFGDLDPARFDRDFRAYLERTETMVQDTAYAPRPAAAPGQAAPMSEAQVRLLWARLRPWTDGESARINADLDAARDSDPASAEVHFVRGLFALRNKRTEEADRELGRAVSARPADARYLLGLARLTENDWRAREVPPEAAKRLAALVDRLSKVATTPAELDFVGGYHAEMDHPDTGLPFAERALQANPACEGCIGTYAVLLVEQGRFDDAGLVLRRAGALVGGGERDARKIDRLREYAALLRQQRQAAETTPPALSPPPVAP